MERKRTQRMTRLSIPNRSLFAGHYQQHFPSNPRNLHNIQETPHNHDQRKRVQLPTSVAKGRTSADQENAAKNNRCKTE